MIEYFVNKNPKPDGSYEMHREDCSLLPVWFNRIPLGRQPDCKKALEAAKKIYPTANGCYYCAPECHLV